MGAKGFGDDRAVKTVRGWKRPHGVLQVRKLDFLARAPWASRSGDNHERLVVENLSMQMLRYGRCQNWHNDQIEPALLQGAINRRCFAGCDVKADLGIWSGERIHDRGDESSSNGDRATHPELSRGRVSKELNVLGGLLQLIKSNRTVFQEGTRVDRGFYPTGAAVEQTHPE